VGESYGKTLKRQETRKSVQKRKPRFKDPDSINPRRIAEKLLSVNPSERIGALRSLSGNLDALSHVAQNSFHTDVAVEAVKQIGKMKDSRKKEGALYKLIKTRRVSSEALDQLKGMIDFVRPGTLVLLAEYSSTDYAEIKEITSRLGEMGKTSELFSILQFGDGGSCFSLSLSELEKHIDSIGNKNILAVIAERSENRESRVKAIKRLVSLGAVKELKNLIRTTETEEYLIIGVSLINMGRIDAVVDVASEFRKSHIPFPFLERDIFKIFAYVPEEFSRIPRSSILFELVCLPKIPLKIKAAAIRRLGELADYGELYELYSKDFLPDEVRRFAFKEIEKTAHKSRNFNALNAVISNSTDEDARKAALKQLGAWCRYEKSGRTKKALELISNLAISLDEINFDAAMQLIRLYRQNFTKREAGNTLKHVLHLSMSERVSMKIAEEFEKQRFFEGLTVGTISGFPKVKNYSLRALFRHADVRNLETRIFGEAILHGSKDMREKSIRELKRRNSELALDILEHVIAVSENHEDRLFAINELARRKEVSRLYRLASSNQYEDTAELARSSADKTRSNEFTQGLLRVL